jgi:hypothetical protein
MEMAERARSVFRRYDNFGQGYLALPLVHYINEDKMNGTTRKRLPPNFNGHLELCLAL